MSTTYRLEDLHRRTQIARLRELAEVALYAFDLPPVSLTLIAHLFNTTFRVDSATGERYVLRIHRAGSPTVSSVGAELAWLAAIRHDTRLEVPSPVATRDGSLLTVAATPHIPDGKICVLFRWLPGHLVDKGLTPRHLRHVGELMAHVQNHGATWVSHKGRFVANARGRVDYPIDSAKGLADPFAPEIIRGIYTLVSESLSEVEATEVVEALAQIKRVESALGTGPDAFGLIHADMHHWNLLFQGEGVKVIDFDDCGFGPLLYDHAVTLNELVDRPQYLALRAALLSGYREVRPLLHEHEMYINTFIALRRIQDGLWTLAWRKHPAIGADWAAHARRKLDAVPALLASSRG